jgi:hypothetical protein
MDKAGEEGKDRVSIVQILQSNAATTGPESIHKVKAQHKELN